MKEAWRSSEMVAAAGVDIAARSLYFSWVIWITVALLFHILLPYRHRLPLFFSEMFTYGKLKNSTDATSSTGQRFLPSILKLINSVPRRYFTHFYVWGSFWNIFLLTAFTVEIIRTAGDEDSVLERKEIEVFLALSLLSLQTIRRLLECVFVTHHSTCTMHCIHYILGLYFYTAVGPTALLHIHLQDRKSETLTTPLHWRHLIAVVIFFWASYQQYKCHSILANIRSGGTGTSNTTSNRHKSVIYQSGMDRENSTSGSVGIPKGGWFELVSSPHYTAEIVIYSSLLLLEWDSMTMVCPCAFVLIVLSLSARQMHSWYCRKFDDYPTERKIIIPYIL